MSTHTMFEAVTFPHVIGNEFVFIGAAHKIPFELVEKHKAFIVCAT